VNSKINWDKCQEHKDYHQIKAALKIMKEKTPETFHWILSH